MDNQAGFVNDIDMSPGDLLNIRSVIDKHFGKDAEGWYVDAMAFRNQCFDHIVVVKSGKCLVAYENICCSGVDLRNLIRGLKLNLMVFGSGVESEMLRLARQVGVQV